MHNLRDIVEYKEKIVDVPIDQIDRNPLNPRKRFVDTEEDALIDSILAKGLLNPIIVFKESETNRYIILDGERRYRAYRKLNLKSISCHILENEPSELENLSMMFHLHNVREEWTDFAIAQTLLLIVDRMGKKHRNLNRQDRLELVSLTSLSEYKIKKYLSFYDYPEVVIQKFMDSEMQETPIKGMDPDILSEMHAPIKIIRKELKPFLTKFDEEALIDACVAKKAAGIIKTNREFRDLTKSLKAMQKGSVRRDVMNEKFEAFVENLEMTPHEIFESTAESQYHVDAILKKADSLIDEIQNLNLKQVTDLETKRINARLNTLNGLRKSKFRDV